jgi:sulfate transport system permease protein
VTLTAPPVVDGGAAPVSGAPKEVSASRLTGISRLGLGTAVLWLSLLVLLPLSAVVVRSTGNGWSGFWHSMTAPGSLDALRLTLLSSLLVSGINAVMGTLIAWVLVRDEFPGRRLVEVVIDIPFALPTIVAGVVLLALYGPTSPVGVDLLGTQRAVVFALLFVTVPFVVRTVQPVLINLEQDVEEAAASLGAGAFVRFRRVILPAIAPAIASGTALAFARAMGEYGSVLLLSGGVFRARVSSLYAFQQIQNFDYVGAATTATVLLVVSAVVLALLDLINRRVSARG